MKDTTPVCLWHETRITTHQVDAANLEVIDLPPTCGGILVGWDVVGGAHCDRCQPPRHGQRLGELARRLRKRHSARRRTHGLPHNACAAAGMTADPSDAGGDSGASSRTV